MKKMIDERDDAVDKKVEETKEEDPVVITAAPTPVEEGIAGNLSLSFFSLSLGN